MPPPSADKSSDSARWAAATDPYGSAAAIPGLLGRAESDPPDTAVWQELWGRLCHQGTVYEASFLAIPSLARIARSAKPAAYSQPLNLLASIAGSTDVSGTPDTRERYADVLASCLPAAAAYAAEAADDTDFCFALSVVSGLRGDRAWHQLLTYVADGEAFGACPGCSASLQLSLDTDPPRVSLFGEDPPDGPEFVLAEPATINGLAAEFLAMAEGHSRGNVTKRLLAILGGGHCPACGQSLVLGNAFGLNGGNLT